jgi:hypothetical protein
VADSNVCITHSLTLSRLTKKYICIDENDNELGKAKEGMRHGYVERKIRERVRKK